MKIKTKIRTNIIIYFIIILLLFQFLKYTYAINDTIPGYILKKSIYVMDDILETDFYENTFYFINNNLLKIIDIDGKTIFEDEISLEPIAFAAYNEHYVIAVSGYIEIGRVGQGVIKDIYIEGINDIDLAGDYLLVADMYGLKKLNIGGDLIWSVNETGPLFVVYYDGLNIYAANEFLYRFTSDGKIVWNISLNDIALAIISGNEDQVYVGTSTSIYKIVKGQVEWVYNLSSPIYSIATCKDKVFAATGRDIFIFSVDGNLISKIRYGEHISFIFCDDSKFYVITSNKLNEYEKATGVSILTIPKGAVVYINGSNYGKTPLIVDLSPGYYEIRLVYGDYIIEDDFNVELGSNLVLEYTFNGTLVVFAFPDASEIYLGNNFMGYGKVSVDIRPGNYTVKIRYGDYTLSKKVMVEPAKTTKITLNLMGKLHVITKPEGLIVRLNNSNIGVTPFKVSLAPGIYNLEVIFKNKKVSELIHIEPNQTLNINIIFNASIFFDVIPSTSTIYLNDTRIHEKEIEVEPGNYVINIQCGNKKWTDVINLSPGEHTKVKVVFNTSLDIESIPEKADVFLNGTKLGTTPLKIEVPAQLYFVKVVYQQSSYSLLLDLRDCAKKSVNVVFNGTLVVNTFPPGLEVYVDDDFMGKTPLETSLRAGNHVVEIRYFIFKKIYKIKLNVEKYEISMIAWEIILLILTVVVLIPIILLLMLIIKTHRRIKNYEKYFKEDEW